MYIRSQHRKPHFQTPCLLSFLSPPAAWLHCELRPYWWQFGSALSCHSSSWKGSAQLGLAQVVCIITHKCPQNTVLFYKIQAPCSYLQHSPMVLSTVCCNAVTLLLVSNVKLFTCNHRNQDQHDRNFSFCGSKISVGNQTKSLKNHILYDLLLNHLELGNASLGNRNPPGKEELNYPTKKKGNQNKSSQLTLEGIWDRGLGDLFVHRVCHTTCLVMLHRGKFRAHAGDLMKQNQVKLCETQLICKNIGNFLLRHPQPRLYERDHASPLLSLVSSMILRFRHAKDAVLKPC